MGTIAREIAAAEVDAWLDYQGISAEQKAQLAANVERMIKGVQDGMLTIDKNTFDITQKLRFSFGKETKITEIKLKSQITVSELHDQQKKIKPDDIHGQGLAYAAAAAGEMIEVLGKMHHKDYNLTDAIVVFFML
jgi:hypothetical protein